MEKKAGDPVTSDPHDNADCVGNLMLRHKDHLYLDRRIDDLVEMLQSKIIVEPTSEK